jgi:hypothetical protein
MLGRSGSPNGRRSPDLSLLPQSAAAGSFMPKCFRKCSTASNRTGRLVPSYMLLPSQSVAPSVASGAARFQNFDMWKNFGSAIDGTTHHAAPSVMVCIQWPSVGFHSGAGQASTAIGKCDTVSFFGDGTDGHWLALRQRHVPLRLPRCDPHIASQPGAPRTVFHAGLGLQEQLASLHGVVDGLSRLGSGEVVVPVDVDRKGFGDGHGDVSGEIAAAPPLLESGVWFRGRQRSTCPGSKKSPCQSPMGWQQYLGVQYLDYGFEVDKNQP